jgi:hypothetical protein
LPSNRWRRGRRIKVTLLGTGCPHGSNEPLRGRVSSWWEAGGQKLLFDAGPWRLQRLTK